MSFLMRSVSRLQSGLLYWRGSDGSGSLDTGSMQDAGNNIGLKTGSWKLAVVACDIVTRDTSWVGLQNLRLQTFETLRL